MKIVPGVKEGEAGALAPTVHKGGGSSCPCSGTWQHCGSHLCGGLLLNNVIKMIVKIISKNSHGKKEQAMNEEEDHSIKILWRVLDLGYWLRIYTASLPQSWYFLPPHYSRWLADQSQ